jgi:hypothetical protein
MTIAEFKSDFKIEGYFPPITFTSTLDGQKYAICGSNWIPIPTEMTHQEVHERWVKKEFKKPEPNQIEKIVTASRGKTEYRVTFNDKWNCTCSSFKFRRKECKHIESVKLELRNKFKK